MAARSVLKLFNKTCSYTFNSVYTSSLSNTNQCKDSLVKQQRSYSQTRTSRFSSAQESFFQSRKISRSLENLKDSRYLDEEPQRNEGEDELKHLRVYYLQSADLSKDAAKDLKTSPPEEKNEEGNIIYELSESTRDEENYFEVYKTMMDIEKDKSCKAFPHLQPQNIKPYGSNENLYFPELFKKRIKIVYPTTNYRIKSIQDVSQKKKGDHTQFKEFSNYRTEKEHPEYEETKKIAVYDKSIAGDFNKMNYSTNCTISKKATKSSRSGKTTKLTLPVSSNIRKSSTVVAKYRKPLEKKNINVQNGQKSNLGTLDNFYNKISEYKTNKQKRENHLKCDSRGSNLEDNSRQYTTYTKSPSDPICENYVTVKLKQLQEECREAKKCKAKKINFGRLPKLTSPDCPCIEDIPLKEGKPLIRLKKRLEPKARENVCEHHVVCPTPRADANYKIVSKSLPAMKVYDCPCTEPKMTDLVIKRLPKKKIAEPPRVCPPCIEEPCCPDRSDKDLKIRKKVLPKLEINDCPCIEAEPMKTVPIARLKPKAVQEPPKICIKPSLCVERADDNLKVEKKQLPILKAECICVESPPMEDVPPLRRLKKFKFKDKPKYCPVVVCTDIERADKDLKVEQKRLPVFQPQQCPCIEEEILGQPIELKRLKKRSIPKEKKIVCRPVVICGHEAKRADEGLVIKPKKLPEIKMVECPCDPPVMVDVEPLKRLIPKPVKEPPKICGPCVEEECCPPRSDANLKPPEKKALPVLPPGNCPCLEAEPPSDVPPLVKLKKRPVSPPKRICPVAEKCPPRADENMKIEIKKLPKLEVPDCPCIEAPAPDDVKPLKRLKKVHVPEPARVCIKHDDCEETPRADEDDWMYWKRVEVNSAECKESKDKNKSGKRNYSTNTKVDEDDLFHLKYDVANLRTNQFKRSYNIIIDIKPSAPLILAQTPIENEVKNFFSDVNLNKKRIKQSKTDPLDEVAFIIYKSNNLGSSKSKSCLVKDGISDSSLLFNTINRFISTSSTFCQYTEKFKDKTKDHQTPPCECPINDAHLQPKNPIIPEKETFIKPFPTDELIDDSAKKGRMFHRARKVDEGEMAEPSDLTAECKDETESKEMKTLCEVVEEEEEEECKKPSKKPERKLTLWERIVNYFKARPDCPSPEEFKKMRLREDAEKAASKAGLCLYDPKEMLRKNEKELPKVITAENCKDELKNDQK